MGLTATQSKLGHKAAIMLLACVAVITGGSLGASAAMAQSCHGTLVPLSASTANDTKYAISCDVAVGGRYTLQAAGSSGAPLAGTVHSVGQGYSCSAAAGGEEEEVETEAEEAASEGGPDLSDWICIGGSAAAGAKIEGSFAAQSDPCAAALMLRVTLYSGAGRAVRPLTRTVLSISCSNSSTGNTISAIKPRISNMRVSPSRFRAANRGASITTATGSTVTYILSTAARTTFKVERASSGVLSGGRCVAPSKANRSKRHCVRYARLSGSFTQSARSGANRFHFTGRLAGRKLTPDGYRFAASARSAAGLLSSQVHSAVFHIVR